MAFAFRANAHDPHSALRELPRLLELSPRAESLPDDLPKLFKKTALDGKTYKKGACCDNICRLLTQMQTKKLDLSRARVLYILKQGGEPELVPLKSRQRNVIWGFHVVLEVDGEIFDFDYGDELEPVGSRKYFMDMFVLTEKGTSKEEEEQLKGIHLRAIPAREYLSDFGPVCDFDSYIKNEVKGRDYPSQTAWEFLGPPPPRGLTQLMVPYGAPLRRLTTFPR